MWRGWTTRANADAYEKYLEKELFPRLHRELSQRGYRGYHLLRLLRDQEAEFVTMVWFDSLPAVRAFAGDDYQTPVISATAMDLLSRYQEHCDHFELIGSQWITSGQTRLNL